MSLECGISPKTNALAEIADVCFKELYMGVRIYVRTKDERRMLLDKAKEAIRELEIELIKQGEI